MPRIIRLAQVGSLLFGAVIAMPSLAAAQSGSSGDTTAAEDPNDKTQHDRSFEETRKHMQLHSEWSKKSGKMSDN